MTESSEPPSDRRENTQGTPQATPQYPSPYQYQSQPGPQSGGYPAAQPQSYYGYPPAPMGPRNGLGIASLVLAIIALLSVWSVFGGIILGLAALIIGLVARGRVKRGEATNGGVAIAGVVLGALAVIVGLAFLAIWMTFWKDIGGDDYMSCLQKAGSDPVKQQQCQQQFNKHLQNEFSVTLTPTPAP